VQPGFRDRSCGSKRGPKFEILWPALILLEELGLYLGNGEERRGFLWLALSPLEGEKPGIKPGNIRGRARHGHLAMDPCDLLRAGVGARRHKGWNSLPLAGNLLHFALMSVGA